MELQKQTKILKPKPTQQKNPDNQKTATQKTPTWNNLLKGLAVWSNRIMQFY